MGPQRKDIARRQLSASQREAAILGNTQSQCAGHLLLTWPSQYVIDVMDQLCSVNIQPVQISLEQNC